jgi:hypothetical protein
MTDAAIEIAGAPGGADDTQKAHLGARLRRGTLASLISRVIERSRPS